MRTMILLTVSIFTVVVAFCYSAAWYLQAWQMESALENALARASDKHLSITYDAIEMSGFPKHIKATIINPHIKGRVDRWLQDLPQNSRSGLPAWEEDISLDGHITLGVNLFANRYSLHLAGHMRNSSQIAGESHHLLTEIAGESHCNLQFANRMGIFSSLWDFSNLQREPEELLHDFRLLDCYNPGYTVMDQHTRDIMLASGPSRLFIENGDSDSNADARQIRLYASMADSEVTPGGDGVMVAYMNALFPETPAQPNFSLYGKKNAEIDFAYHGPIALQDELKTTPIDIKLNQFSLTNQVYQSNASFHFNNGGDGQERATHLTFKSESHFTPQYDAMLQEMVRGLVLQLYSPFIPQPADIQPLIRKHRADELYNLIHPAIPNMHSLGKLAQSVDLSYRGSPDMKAGDITLASLNFSAAPYGISGRGAIKMSPSQAFPAANIALTCENCTRLIDDVTHYVLRLQRVLQALSERPATLPAIDTRQVNGLKAFLAALADPSTDPANKTTFSYTLVSDGMSGITISGKRLDEILTLYNQTLGQQATPEEE